MRSKLAVVILAAAVGFGAASLTGAATSSASSSSCSAFAGNVGQALKIAGQSGKVASSLVSLIPEAYKAGAEGTSVQGIVAREDAAARILESSAAALNKLEPTILAEEKSCLS
jgi:hypothetical protein